MLLAVTGVLTTLAGNAFRHLPLLARSGVFLDIRSAALHPSQALGRPFVSSVAAEDGEDHAVSQKSALALIHKFSGATGRHYCKG